MVLQCLCDHLWVAEEVDGYKGHLVAKGQTRWLAAEGVYFLPSLRRADKGTQDVRSADAIRPGYDCGVAFPIVVRKGREAVEDTL